ncbi:MAG TPA: hypothetical protein VHU84_12045 [Lacipirellulaceae bacterium]|nr:hypothetical protein [Lacipirellulaceae bacterium]
MAQSSRNPAIDGNSLIAIAAWFGAGAIVTAIFSGSLAFLVPHADFREVLVAGMIIPSFTWLVHLTAAGVGLTGEVRSNYWLALGHACFWGSVALLPAALINLLMPSPPLWVSAANVLASVAVMSGLLFRGARRFQLSVRWCATIFANIAIFTWRSWNWW